MTQTLWITYGTYKDRFVSMKNVDADDARAHHFGFLRIPDWTIPDATINAAMSSFVPADVPFLVAWQGRLQAATYNPIETPAAPTPPTAIALNPSTNSRTAGIGVLVGTLTATDADQTGGGHTFRSSDLNFTIAGMNVDQVYSAKLTGPAAGPYVMTVTAYDSEGGSFTGPVTITMTA
jgi:hypothetical protein